MNTEGTIELESSHLQHLIKTGLKVADPMVATNVRWKVDDNLMDGSGGQPVLTSQKWDNQT